MDLIIKMLNGTTCNLRVQPEDTVGSLKQAICQTLEVSPHNQRLIFENGHRVTLSDNTRRLCDCGLQSGSQLSLLVIHCTTIQVFLKNEKGQTTTYDISPEETVSGFKAKVQAREGVQASQQRLIHEGREMNEGNLADYNVHEHSTIYLTFRLRGG